MLTAIVIQARINSTRLPEKIFSDLCGRTAIEQLYRRCLAAKIKGHTFKVLVACPKEDEIKIFSRTGITPIPGPEKDVLTRLLIAADTVGADKMVRVTADCPLACPRTIEAMVNQAYFGTEPVVTNWKARTFPNGMDLEVYDVKWLKSVSKLIESEDDREWFASCIVNQFGKEIVCGIVNPENMSGYRLTLDYPEDLELIRRIYKAMGNEIWDAQTIIGYLQARPLLKRINAKYATEWGARPK